MVCVVSCHVICDVMVMSCTTPVLLCTTKYYSTTPYYKYYSVLIQNYPVLQSTVTQVLLCTTPVLPCTTKYYCILPCTTKYYSSTNLYYKALLQYYPVLQSTIPVLLCTTKYFFNTTLYYKVRLQYYSVLQILHLYYSSTTLYYNVPLKYLLCTTPVLPCTTNYSSTTPYYKARRDWSASQMKRHLQCAERQKAACNFSKYCACRAKWISWLIRIAYATSFTMRGATGSTLQLHQILRLPRKMNVMIDPHHICNVIYNAESNKHKPPTSPNTAPATHNECHDWATSQMKHHLQCAEQQATPSNLTNYCACHA